jgi:threonine dehydratase
MPVRPGQLTFEHTQAFVDDIVRVSDDAIRAATQSLLAHAKLIVEFSGAATLAAVTSGAYNPDGQNTVAVLSGGNLDPARFPELVW